MKKRRKTQNQRIELWTKENLFLKASQLSAITQSEMETKLKKAQSTNTVSSKKEPLKREILFQSFSTEIVTRCLLEHDDTGNLLHQKDLIVEIQRCALTNDIKLVQFFKSASEAIAHFSETHLLLLQQVIKAFPWTTNNESIVRAFSDWLCNLVSAQNGFVEYVHRFLVMVLLPQPSPTQIQGPLRLEVSTREPEEILTRERVLSILKNVLILSPRSSTLLQTAVEKSFPHFLRFSTYQHRTYLKNVIGISRNHKELRDQLLISCIRKMVEMDAYITLEEIPEEEELLFSVEIDEKAKEMLEVAEKLDHYMDVFLQELDTFYESGEYSIFTTLIRAFDSSLLSVVKSKYTQFVMFYFCRLKTEFADEFLTYLLSRLFDSNLSVITRRTCAAYVGSFLSRATYITNDMVKRGISQLLQWLHLYVQRQAAALPDPEIHALFYSVVQSVCYIVCFYQNTLFQGHEGREYFESLDFDKIVSCKLNPLKFCVDAILNEFANIARRLNAVTIVEVTKRNEKIVLSNAYRNLEPYFPFDPYLLRVSSKLINPFYRNWTSSATDEEELSDSKSHSSTPQTGSLDIKNMSFTPTINTLEFHFRNSLEV